VEILPSDFVFSRQDQRSLGRDRGLADDHESVVFRILADLDAKRNT
jgi:hypothetical protein